MTDNEPRRNSFSRRSNSGPPFRIMIGVIAFILVMIAVVLTVSGVVAS